MQRSSLSPSSNNQQQPNHQPQSQLYHPYQNTSDPLPPSTSPIPPPQSSQSPQSPQSIARTKKTIREAQTSAFTTQLFYYSMKILFCYVLYKYENILTHDYLLIGLYGLMLIVNCYMIGRAGKEPGDARIGREGKMMGGQQQILIQDTQYTIQPISQQSYTTTTTPSYGTPPSPRSTYQPIQYCQICKINKKPRTKHCYRCGYCIRKFDHHCPWIGTCVGQDNHFIFVLMLLGQTIQAISSFLICFKSLSLYQYNTMGLISTPSSSTTSPYPQLSYSKQFGTFTIFSFFMFIYIMFVISLLCFHTYLLLNNLTTIQLMYRSKAKYLRNIKGNPYNKGLLTNIKQCIYIPKGGYIVNGKYKEMNMKEIIRKIKVGLCGYGVINIMIVVDIRVRKQGGRDGDRDREKYLCDCLVGYIDIMWFVVLVLRSMILF